MVAHRCVKIKINSTLVRVVCCIYKENKIYEENESFLYNTANKNFNITRLEVFVLFFLIFFLQFSFHIQKIFAFENMVALSFQMFLLSDFVEVERMHGGYK